MYRRKVICCVLVFILLMTVFTACKKAEDTSGDADVVPTAEAVTPTPTVEATPEPTPTTSAFVCTLTNIGIEDEFTSRLRPIAVMIDNQAAARPQSGISKAEIVYEFPVEGKITRYLAIFHHNEADKIGPVRSARPYFIDEAMEYNAVYVHCGGSEQALSDIDSLKVDALNDLNGDPCFWRSKDRSAPHNLYTSTKLMREVIATKKKENSPAPQYFSFNNEFTGLDGKAVKGISIRYDKNYVPSFEYDESNKLFYRMINGKNDIDKETGEKISTVNIIVEMVGVKVLDDVGRLEVSNIGKGRGYYMTGGKLIEVEWSKSSRKSKTVYKDLKGNEIKLNTGNTWIQIVPNYATIEIKE
ncbi:MAG: DUF3048 domain-containing protein [Bacillota bacterium]